MYVPATTALLSVMMALFLAAPGHVVGQDARFRGWVALFEPESLTRLENENRLTDLCAQIEDLTECYSRELAPSIDVFPLYPRPDTAASPNGEVVVTVVPGRGLYAYYRAFNSAQAEWFRPDVFLQDWGYGPPYFHQTIAQEQGNWFQLPPGPWASEVWILKRWDARDRTVLSVRSEDIVELDGRGMFVVQATSESLSMRPEQDADLWCEEGDAPPLRPAPSRTYTRAELVDANGHLRIRPKYMKGC